MIRTKSVHTEIEESDGLRILVARFRGRGISNDCFDVWMANLGPSEQLLRGFQNGEIDWKAFRKAYLDEILTSAEFDAKNKTIRNHGQKFTLRLLKDLAERGEVTLLCHCAEDTPFCHRHLLKELIESSKI